MDIGPTVIPLMRCASEAVGRLAVMTGSPALADLDGGVLLGERAMCMGLKVPAGVSAGGGCRFFAARNDAIALNLARSDDRSLLAALLQVDGLDTHDDAAIAAHIRACDAEVLVARGRSLGLAIAMECESRRNVTSLWRELISGPVRTQPVRRQPRVLDLSALWAGPLAGHLLWLAGAEVIKVESRSRPDSMRAGHESFYGLLNQGKASVVLDFADPADVRALQALVNCADIVIEAARPRALLQLGIDATQSVKSAAGLTWITITGHGAEGEAANSIGFGDDCGVAGGLSGALRAATGRGGFVGDAIADPLTGIAAAVAAWEGWQSRRSGRIGLAMSEVVGFFLAREAARDQPGWRAQLLDWKASIGKPFRGPRRAPRGNVAAFGADTRAWLERIACA